MKTLDLKQSIDFAKKHKIDFCRTVFVSKKTDLNKIKIAFPWVLKIVSQKISHKSDVKGVIVGIKNFAEAEKEFSRLSKLNGFSGVIVQEMIKGTELIIGGKMDEQFGETVLVGVGGIFTEVFKDFSLRICPVNQREAMKMLKELKAFPVLSGTRGRKTVNLKKIALMIENVSKMMIKTKITEVDFNPVIVNSEKVLAVDARVIK